MCGTNMDTILDLNNANVDHETFQWDAQKSGKDYDNHYQNGESISDSIQIIMCSMLINIQGEICH